MTGTVCRRPASWHAKSLADVAALGPLDLRRPAHAARMAAALSEIDPDALLALLKSPAK